MEIQRLLGSDIVMAFDECPALPATEAAVAASMRLLDALGGAVAGGVRGPAGARAVRDPAGAASRASCARSSAAALKAIGFDGYAIGGLAVGEGQAAMFAGARLRRRACCRRTGRAT